MVKTVPSDNRHLYTIAKNSAIGIIGQVFFLLMRFFTAILVTRTLGPRDYGIFLLAFNIITGLRVVSLLGFEPAMIKFVAQYSAQKNISRVKGVINFALFTSAMSSLFLAIALFVFADLVANHIFKEIHLTPVLRVMLIGFPFSTLLFVILAALQGAKLVKYKILVEEVMLPMFRFTLIAAVFWIGLRLMGVAWVWSITAIFGMIQVMLYLNRHVGGLFHLVSEIKGKEILSFSTPLLLSNLFTKNATMAVFLLIGAFYPASQVGIYGVAMRIIPLIRVPFRAYTTIFDPVVSGLYAQGDMAELEKIYKIGGKWILLITIPLFTLIIYYAMPIVSIFGSGFAESANILVILSIGQVINVATGPAGGVLKMTGRPFYNLFNSGMFFILNIALTLVMMKFFGIIGAAYAFSFSMIIVNVIQTIEVWYLYGIHPYRWDYIKPLLSCFVSFITVYYSGTFFYSPNIIISVISFISTFIGCYALLLMLMGLSQEDRMILNKFRHRLSNVFVKS